MHDHEASFYAPAGNRRVRCALCALRCSIAEGRLGVCRVRENRGGRLLSLSYGMLTSAASDPIEKKPLFHFMPSSRSFSVATAGCNLQCPWCQNHDLSQFPRRERSMGRFSSWTPPERIVKLALSQGCGSVSYTYSEPTIFYEYARDIGRLARKRGLRNVFVTNGMMTPEVIEDATCFLDGANVDLKGATRSFYRKHCKGSLDAVLESIRTMHRLGMWVEVTTLVIPGQNDSDGDLGFMAEFIASVSIDIPWHVSRFHPDNEWLALPRTPLDTLRRAAGAGRKAGLRYIYMGNVPGEGFEDTRCPRCDSLLIRRMGFHATVKGMDHGRCASCGFAPAGVWNVEKTPRPE
jgi:pyruvate formate lyase activating enzyme